MASAATAEKSDNTGLDSVPDKPWLFKSGDNWNGNANGRPKGSKNALSEDFIAALHKNFNEHGEAAIEEVRQTDPGQYLRVIASIVPKDYKVTIEDDNQTEEQILAKLRKLRDALGPIIDATAINVDGDRSAGEAADSAADEPT